MATPTPELVPHPRLGHAAMYGADLHRTGLSWTRTALDLGLVSLVMLRVAAMRDVFVVVNLCLVLIVAAVGLAIVARGRTHRCQAYGQASDARLPVAIVGLALAINAVGMIMVLSVR
jgi:hypothetical protein